MQRLDQQKDSNASKEAATCTNLQDYHAAARTRIHIIESYATQSIQLHAAFTQGREGGAHLS
jgi:hypothetical protein